MPNQATQPMRHLSAATYAAGLQRAVTKVNSGQCVEINGSLFSAGSVVAYAQEKAECPVLAVERAIAGGEKLRWLSPKPVTISNPPMPREVPDVTLAAGDIINFDGCISRVESTWNRNFNVTPLTVEELTEEFGIEQPTFA